MPSRKKMASRSSRDSNSRSRSKKIGSRCSGSNLSDDLIVASMHGYGKRLVRDEVLLDEIVGYTQSIVRRRRGDEDDRDTPPFEYAAYRQEIFLILRLRHSHLAERPVCAL